MLRDANAAGRQRCGTPTLQDADPASRTRDFEKPVARSLPDGDGGTMSTGFITACLLVTLGFAATGCSAGDGSLSDLEKFLENLDIGGGEGVCRDISDERQSGAQYNSRDGDGFVEGWYTYRSRL